MNGKPDSNDEEDTQISAIQQTENDLLELFEENGNDVEIDTISVVCHDGVDGQISIQLTGVGLYSTTWSTQQSGNIISNLAPGLYVFTVLDTSGCSYTDSVFLNNPSQISTSGVAA